MEMEQYNKGEDSDCNQAQIMDQYLFVASPMANIFSAGPATIAYIE